jgi:proline iminopeptidase
MLGMLGSDEAYQKVFSHVWRYYFKDPKQAPAADKAWLSGIRARAVNLTRRSIVGMPDQKLSNLSKLHIPVCLVYGANDIYGNSRKHSIERWPNAKCVTMSGVGHLPWIQGKQEFVHVLDSFYSK